MKHSSLSRGIINCYYTVYNTLGYGFLEKVYENALLLELRSRGYTCSSQVPIKVHYKEEPIGLYYADIIVENKIILELKAAENLCQEHVYQLINYLKATDIEIGLLLNFGKEPQFARKVFSNDRQDPRESA